MGAAGRMVRHSGGRPGASALLCLLPGCGASRRWALNPRPPADVCITHLVDSRSDARLTLQRSAQSLGDYGVDPARRYGVGALELLRVECGTARPLGIVPRDG